MATMGPGEKVLKEGKIVVDFGMTHIGIAQWKCVSWIFYRQQHIPLGARGGHSLLYFAYPCRKDYKV